MNSLTRVMLVAALTVAAAGFVGCKQRPKNITPIPGYEGAGSSPVVEFTPTDPVPGGPGRTGSGSGLPPGGAYNPNEGPGRTDIDPAGAGAGGELPEGDLRDGMVEDRAMFSGNTVYFDFDKSVVKKSELAKVGAVAEYLKANGQSKLLVEGHCDERGTDGYNLALGERRALAVRDQLINLGVGGERVSTISYGESRPADLGHDNAAWAKNRRGEFILLTPPGAVR